MNRATTADRSLRFLAVILLAGAVVTPVYISVAGDDHFRVPKELVLIATATVAVASAAIAFVLRKVHWRDIARPQMKWPTMLAAAGLVWTLLTTARSTNRALSVEALVWVTALGAIFLIGSVAFRTIPLWWLSTAILIPALVNAGVVILQGLELWNPWVFPPGTAARGMRNALLGNPNYVGVYLAAPLLFALTQALHGTRRRWWYAAAAVVLAAGVLVTLTLTAIGALLLAVAVLAIRWDRRRGALIVGLAVVTLGVFSAAHPLMRLRLTYLAEFLGNQQWGRMVSGRVFPFYVATQMFEDHPLLGVGPGCFKFHYMPYAIRTADDHPRLVEISDTQRVNFGEAHNDHLQVLAEVGLPGYVIFVMLIGSVAAASFGRKPAEGERARLAYALAFPLVILLLVVMTAQFALQLAASAVAYIVIAAACVAWRADAVA